LTARTDENANAIDLIFSAKGLNATDKARSVANLVFAENCIKWMMMMMMMMMMH
jgi:hypothetical protein